jgi:very-short-patch-repair endonuclease
MQVDNFSRSFLDHYGIYEGGKLFEPFVENIIRDQENLDTSKIDDIADAFFKTISIILGVVHQELILKLIPGITNIESPKEKLFTLALLATAARLETNVVLGTPSKGERRHRDMIDLFERNSDHLVIDSQYDVGDFRVDFLLELNYRVIDLKKVTELSSKKRIPVPTMNKAQLIVECDGHDFHEKTKEQVKKDKSRDRILQSVGYTVFHFTGSEIYNDCFGCTKQCLDFLRQKV